MDNSQLFYSEVLLNLKQGASIVKRMRNSLSKITVLIFTVTTLVYFGQINAKTTESAKNTGVRGDAAAITKAEAMVAAMGGITIWREIKSLHFVHLWDIINRPDVYLENEILDFTGPRSWVTMESEIYYRKRAYSPEHGRWNIVNGKFSIDSKEALLNSLERAPYSLFRLAAAIARGDNRYDIQFGPMLEMPGSKEIPNTKALEFRGDDDQIHGWILLNARNEPMIWSTRQYTYVLGPLAQFGSLKVPDWATTTQGRVRYKMVSLHGSNQAPDQTIFEVPKEFREK